MIWRLRCFGCFHEYENTDSTAKCEVCGGQPFIVGQREEETTTTPAAEPEVTLDKAEKPVTPTKAPAQSVEAATSAAITAAKAAVEAAEAVEKAEAQAPVADVAPATSAAPAEAPKE